MRALAFFAGGIGRCLAVGAGRGDVDDDAGRASFRAPDVV